MKISTASRGATHTGPIVDSFEDALSSSTSHGSPLSRIVVLAVLIRGNGSWIDYFFCNRVEQECLMATVISSYLYKEDKNQDP